MNNCFCCCNKTKLLNHLTAHRRVLIHTVSTNRHINSRFVHTCFLSRRQQHLHEREQRAAPRGRLQQRRRGQRQLQPHPLALHQQVGPDRHPRGCQGGGRDPEEHGGDAQRVGTGRGPGGGVDDGAEGEAGESGLGTGVFFRRFLEGQSSFSGDRLS